MLNATNITTTLSDSVATFFGPITSSKNGVSKRQISKRQLNNAYKSFAAENKIWVESLFDMHFLTQHGKPIVTDYVNGLLTRHQAAVDLAWAWETHLVPPSIKISQQQRTEAVKAANSFLAYLPG